MARAQALSDTESGNMPGKRKDNASIRDGNPESQLSDLEQPKRTIVCVGEGGVLRYAPC